MFIKNGKMVLLSRATSSVPSGYLLAFEVIGSKAHKMLGNPQLLILLLMKQVGHDSIL